VGATKSITPTNATIAARIRLAPEVTEFTTKKRS
jgi:hypothetical protein